MFNKNNKNKREVWLPLNILWLAIQNLAVTFLGYNHGGQPSPGISGLFFLPRTEVSKAVMEPFHWAQGHATKVTSARLQGTYVDLTDPSTMVYLNWSLRGSQARILR